MKYLKLLIGISALFSNYAFAQISNQVDSIKQLKEIIITYQADKLTPITFQNISSKDLKTKSTGQEPSFLLSETPSITNYSDAGNSQEDEMTDENGDIVDPNSTICSECNGTGKIIVGCPGLSTIAGHFDVCNNGYSRCGNNCRLGNNGWYYLKNGEVCNRCDQNGNEKCGICAGLGDSYYKYCNNCNR